MTEPPMTADAWERIKTIFHAALDETPDARETFVAHAVGDDTTIRGHVESLLAAHHDAADFMETPAVALRGSGWATRHMPPHHDHVGPYRLLQEIGRGGMGVVYLAQRDDGQFAQRVAIKLVKRGMDSDAILARFRHERNILAALEHPNIARLLDGGTTDDGIPYFVMEYVQGHSIRDYCHARALSVNERLALFRTVCSAVQYAHQNLVVHRDIKSSNIVVSDDGVPKLLDFGIAKLLHPVRGEGASVLTETINALTPEYASPEQLRGEPVTTATDVYSLGVLLYELLAGVRPFATSALRPDELVRAVIGTDPAPPSASVNMSVIGGNHTALQRTLRGDLDTVVLMAIRKEPQRRYSSVERFSDDVGRYLANRPVTAQRDTWQYRASKFVARNRTGLAVGALLLTTLVTGVAATLWQAREARTERTRAERRFAEIRSLATSFLFDIHDEIVNLPGSTPARALLVKRGLQSLDGLIKEAQGDTVLERELGVAYQRLGMVQGNSYNSNLGDSKAALTSYRTSVQLLARSTDTMSKNAAALNELAGAYKGLADMLIITGALTPAMNNLELARAAQVRAVALDTGNALYRSALANVYFELGDTRAGVGLPNIGDTKGGLESYRQTIAVYEWLRKRSPNAVAVRSGLGNTLMNYGSLALSLDDTTGMHALQQGVALLEGVTAEFPNDVTRRDNLLSGYLRLRRPLADAGHYNEAMVLDRKVLTTLHEMVKADPKNMLFARNLSVTYNTLGFDLIGAGRPDEAVAQHLASLAIVERLHSADPASSEVKQDLTYTRGVLADALREAQQYARAIEEYNRSIPIKLELLKAEPEDPRHPADLARLYSGLGAAETGNDAIADAQRVFDKAIPLAETAAAAKDATSRARSTVALLYRRVGELHAHNVNAMRNPAERAAHCREATVWFTRSLTLWQALEHKHELSGANRGQPSAVANEISQCAV